MKFKLWEHVKVKKNGVIGEIIDISENIYGKVYIVESDTKGERDDADYPGEWPLYDCQEDEIERIEIALSVNTIKYIISRVIDNANDDDLQDRSEFTMGRRLAYYEILDTIKNELIVHEQDLKEYGLDFNLEDRFL